jgi:hypothetical protein
MTPRSTRSEISRFSNKLLECGLAIDTNASIIREEAGFTHVIWAGSPRLSMSIHDFKFATIADYLRIIENRQYNFMLYDGSVFRARYLFRRNNLEKHHLSYYPCPVDLTDSELQADIPIAEHFDNLLHEALANFDWQLYIGEEKEGTENNRIEDPKKPILLMKAPIRFDYDPDARNENHSSSHAHIMNPDCRIPVFGPLSLGHFFSFVFRYFYPEEWKENDFIRNWPKEQGNRSITNSDMNDIFFEWRDMVNNPQ